MVSQIELLSGDRSLNNSIVSQDEPVSQALYRQMLQKKACVATGPSAELQTFRQTLLHHILHQYHTYILLVILYLIVVLL